MRLIVFLKMFKIEPRFRKCKKKKKKNEKKRKKIFFVAVTSASENVAMSCLC